MERRSLIEGGANVKHEFGAALFLSLPPSPISPCPTARDISFLIFPLPPFHGKDWYSPEQRICPLALAMAAVAVATVAVAVAVVAVAAVGALSVAVVSVAPTMRLRKKSAEVQMWS